MLDPAVICTPPQAIRSSRLWSALRSPDEPVARARGRRVSLVLIAIALMGLADLLCTLAYMRTIGMVEVNPIARHMIAINGVQQLVMYKLLTILLSCSALYLGRHTRRAEWCTWLCAGVLLALMVHWVRYNAAITSLTNEIAVIALHSDESSTDLRTKWVSFSE